MERFLYFNETCRLSHLFCFLRQKSNSFGLKGKVTRESLKDVNIDITMPAKTEHLILENLQMLVNKHL